MPLDIHKLPRRAKRIVLTMADVAMTQVALYGAFTLRFGTLWPTATLQHSIVLFPLMALAGLLIVRIVGLPRIKLRAFESHAVQQVGLAALLLALAAMASSYLLLLPAPRSVPILFGFIFFVGAVAIRLIARDLLNALSAQSKEREAVAIYGAGAAGIQLASALEQSNEVSPKFFVDDNPNLTGLIIAGLPVIPPSKLEKSISTHDIKRVLVAMPSTPKNQRDKLVEELSHLPVEVRVLPSFIDIIENESLAAGLRTVSPDKLLGRNKVDLDIPEIAKAYVQRVVMVTGAGGSIGSELCRQLLECNPARIVLFERSEFSLYEIDQELRKQAEERGIAITTRLGSVTSKARVAQVIAEEKVDVILHAAAYKHVPLVEENSLEGAQNNVLGTQIVAECAAEAELERFILISTDKAVRPTNVMGATKRMAELVVQDIQTRHPKTRFAMVRFGNVLGSSGSVLPLFEKQIAAGGPVTVTHPEVTRFFMTIPEASRLVLLAGAYATGADVFVLDMGEPLRIIDVARRMITLYGHKVKDPETGEDEGIEIVITGLRPGEKLYEELLLDDDSLCATMHPKILRAKEATLSEIEVAAMLREIGQALTQADPTLLIHTIENRVEGYHRPEIRTTAQL